MHFHLICNGMITLFTNMASRDHEDLDMGGFMDNIVYNGDTQWKPIGLTHVQYIKGDHIGHLLAWFSLAPIFILVAFATLILFRRDLHTVCYAIGIVLDEAINWILKHTIKEHRPDIRRVGLTTEYGMPSSHSQFMAFFSTYLFLFLFIRVHHGENVREVVWKYITALGGIVSAILVAYSRIYLGYHTVSQVLWGSAAGCVLGVLWFIVVHCLLSPHFPMLASSWLGELFMLRDSTLIPNVLWFEYCNHRTEMKNRLRKISSRKLS